MTRTASRSLLTFALLLFPVIASAQATQTPPAKKPATPPVVKPATTPVGPQAARQATGAAQAAKPATTAAAATPTPKPATTAAAATPTPTPATPAVAAAPTAKPATAAAPTTTVAPRAAPARDANGRFMKKAAPATTAVHATCKDGTTWEGAQRAGACARHGGVKSWN